MTNSLKYAFDDEGEITITLSRLNGQYIFIYSDNGKGIQNDTTQSGFGQSLIEMSTEQLGGELEIINNHGLTYQITFKGQL